MKNLTGQSFGRYHILEQLDEGGMAIVYKALDTVLERNVALKVIRSDQFGSAVLSRLLQRFEREGKALAKLSHSNIVKVIDYGDHQGTPYLVMEYLPGGTLKQKMQGKPMRWQDAARSLLPICRALEHAHEKGIIHRDIKPSNILFTPTGEPMLTDFGIAKIISGDEATGDLTNTSVGIGTPEYMAPEQGAGKADERSDIYALGVVYYQMVTGRLPYKADTPMAVMLKKTTEPLPRPKQFAPSLPDDVERFLIKALQLDPNNRYSSARAFCFALESIAEGKPLPKEKPLKEKDSRFPLSLVLGIAGLIGIIAFVLFAVFTYKITTKTPSTPEPTELATLEEPALTGEPIPEGTPILDVPTSVETKVSAKDDSIFALVPEGEFVMGSDPKDPYFWGAEAPKHTVFLDSFWIHLTEVTNSMYRACVNDGACSAPSKESSRTHDDYFNNDSYNDYPVINVTFADASNYCEWIGGRLPTEAEWEKAARGTDGRLFPWGNDEIQDNYANLCDVNCTNLTTPEFGLNDGFAEVAPVGSFPAGASPYGALDVAGNVLEWTSDWYALDYYKNSPSKNPTGPASGNKHPVRGGSWSSLTDGMRPSARTSKSPNESSDLIGFRCAQDDPFAGATDNSASTNGIEMILIPGGEFLRGASSDDLAELATLCPNCSLETLADAQPQTTIYLDAFWIDKTEVTNAQFARFVAETDYRTTAERTNDYSYVQDPGLRDFVYIGDADWQHPQGGSSSIFNQDDYAVTQISWQDAYAYCEWAGKRLPTEAEWEKAARGDDGRLFPWGNRSPRRTDLNFDFSPGYIASVGSYLDGASPYGVLDMSGNVWEWVADYYTEDYYGKAAGANPQGPSSGEGRVMRGGSWASEYDLYLVFVTTFYRLWNYDYISSDVLGFRCASSP